MLVDDIGEDSQSATHVETDAIDKEPMGPPTTTTSRTCSAKKRKASQVWNHFTKIETSKGVFKDANCNYCEKKLNWTSTSGTSSLAKHLRGPCPKFILEDTSTSCYKSPRSEYKFDQLNSRRDLAVACIKHNYPFNIGEHDYFEVFLNGLNPDFKLPSRNTIRADVIGIFEEEKMKIYSLLDNLTCKVSLTTDIWTSEHSNQAYCCMTAHFIDESWNLHKKILAFKLLEYPHDGDKLFNFMKDRIIEWNLDKKLSSIVVDNASANSSMINKLKVWLVSDSLIPFSGDLLHVRCSAHILNLIVQDGLLAVAVVFDPRCKIHIVKYLYTQIYGEDAAVHHICRVQNQLEDLYVFYGGSGISSSMVTSSSSSVGGQSSIWSRFNEWYVESHASSLQQSELEIYLNDPILPQDDKFDILKWWSINASRFPILQKIARDILAIPATTVASESAFSLGGRIIDEARSKLSPDAVEALVVANDSIPTIRENVRIRAVPRQEALGTQSEGDENEL